MRPFHAYSWIFSQQYMDTKNVKEKNPTIYSFDDEEKRNENKSFLKVLCSKRGVLPIIGIV